MSTTRLATTTTLALPPPSTAPEVSSKRVRLLTSKRLAITFVVTLAAVVAGTLAGNALINNGSSNDAMGKWMSSYGSLYLGVSRDVAGVNTATEITSLRPACVKLQGDVGQAQSDPKMPLSSLESQWSVALSDVSAAADDCIKGIDQQDQTLLETAQSHMESAAADYLRLVKAVEQVGG